MKQTGGDAYDVQTPSGIVKFGGGSPGPMNTVAASLLGCLAITLTDTLKAMRQKLDEVEIRASFEREEEKPKLFKHFNVHFIFRGEDLSPAKVEKAIHLAEESTCPVSITLDRAGAEIRTTFAIENKKPA